MNKSAPTLKIILLGFLVGGLLIASWADGIQKPSGERGEAATWVMDLSSFVQKGLLSVSSKVSDTLVTYKALIETQEEIGQLRRTASKAQALSVELDQLKIENRILRRWAHFPDLDNLFRPVGVQVVGRHKTATNEVLRIDQGKNSGIRKGDGVITVEHKVVGRVLWVSENTADILLATNPTSAIDILVHRSRAHGVVRGLGVDDQVNMVVEDFDRLMDVQEGDLLVTAGASGDFPKGLPVAHVVKRFPPHEEVYLKTHLRSVVESKDLELVWVLRRQARQPSPRLGQELTEVFEPPVSKQIEQAPSVALKLSPEKKPSDKEKDSKQHPLKASAELKTKQADSRAPIKKSNVMQIEEIKRLMKVVAPSGVKIRSGPGVEHWVVGTKYKGATLAATGKVKGKDWIRVSLPTGIQGYVFAPLLGNVSAKQDQGVGP